MLNGLFELISGILNFFYANVPGGYAVAIALLTCVVMIVTTPLTLKGTRSMIEMQRLQPEIRRLQVQYKDDRQKLNEELMRFYKEHEINPVGGCLPLLIQAPVFSILFYVVRGLTQQARFVGLQEYTRDLGLTTALQPFPSMALGAFAARSLNLTKLESRPRREVPWEYVFYVDFEGHQEDPDAGAALLDLRSVCTFVRVLGSYPRAAGHA